MWSYYSELVRDSSIKGVFDNGVQSISESREAARAWTACEEERDAIHSCREGL